MAVRNRVVASNVVEGGNLMEQYVRPEVLASYSEEEVVEESAMCASYGMPATDFGN